MKRAFFLFLAGVLSIGAAADETSDQERFRKKYLGGTESGGYIGLWESNISMDINIADLNDTGDINLSGADNQDAIRAFEIINSREGRENVEAMKKFILDDEKYTGKSYGGAIAAEIGGRLFDKEKIIVVLSSSIPAGTIRSYFEDVDGAGAGGEVMFVFRGLRGGDIKSLKETSEYILAIMNKKGEKLTAESRREDYYKVSVDINPKVTRKFKIDRVPAVIYIKNYDVSIEEPKPIGRNESEEYYVAYGAARLSYALETINKKAKSEGLKAFIKTLNNGGFFKERAKGGGK